MRHLVHTILTGLALTAGIGCTQNSSTTEEASLVEAPNVGTLSRSILPTFGNSATTNSIGALAAIPSWVGGSTTSELSAIFVIFADNQTYDPDGDIWGSENLLHIMEINSIIAEGVTGPDGQLTGVGKYDCSATLNPKSSVSSVNCPFGTETSASFSIPEGTTYTDGRTVDISCSINSQTFLLDLSLVWKATTTTYHWLTAQYFPDNPEMTYTEGDYNQSTGDLRVNHASRSGSPSQFLMRTEMEGNVNDKTFTLRTHRWNKVSGSPSNGVAIVGKGVSGQVGSFMIFKTRYNNSSGDPDTQSFSYWCLASDALESDFTTYYNSGTPTNTSKIQKVSDVANFTGDCLGNTLITDVDAMTFPTRSNFLPADETAWATQALSY